MVVALAATEAQVERQQAFHAHRWPDRPEVSVLMTRRDARTVSRTAIEVTEARVSLRYTALNPAGNNASVVSIARAA